eukprot:Pgem_evm1s3204
MQAEINLLRKEKETAELKTEIINNKYNTLKQKYGNYNINNNKASEEECLVKKKLLQTKKEQSGTIVLREECKMQISELINEFKKTNQSFITGGKRDSGICINYDYDYDNDNNNDNNNDNDNDSGYEQEREGNDKEFEVNNNIT